MAAAALKRGAGVNLNKTKLNTNDRTSTDTVRQKCEKSKRKPRWGEMIAAVTVRHAAHLHNLT